MTRIFISHTSKDRELVREIERRLRAAGLETFFVDVDDIAAGMEWKKVLLEIRLRQADAVLALVTPAALGSPWTVTELGIAEGLDKPIVLVTAGLEPQGIPAPLVSYPRFPFDELDGALGKIVRELADSSAKSRSSS
jgi:hypothetical protein